ncbi:uncharacterized protein LOC128984800 [Macrosteles quadrilineatus]|uniref:uncharacterized protein LOC128984800 n=1 Tax=Macrosteles quadrilineatus TaxID=74068 RepID=UPI0023E343FD|nr:uncharacterized protein LOC128984800 [Macrosteles quadrilineatus]
MILPNGQPERALDTGGVLRDCLGEFWTSFYDQFTEGTTLKVPIITQEFKEEQWTAIAKIIKMGWEQEKYFPIKIVPTLFEQCFYKNISSNLVPVFLKCLGAYESKVLEDAILNYSSVDENDLIEVFSNLKSKRKPSKENIAPLLYEIAHRELVQKPFFITECWAPVLYGLMPESTFTALRQNMLPTSKNILERLHSSEVSTGSENNAVSCWSRMWQDPRIAKYVR